MVSRTPLSSLALAGLFDEASAMGGNSIVHAVAKCRNGGWMKEEKMKIVD